MKKIQRFLCGTALLAVLSLLVSATAFAASVPDPTSDFYVNDYVGVLSGDTKSDIVSKNDGLYNATGAQIRRDGGAGHRRCFDGAVRL